MEQTWLILLIKDLLNRKKSKLSSYTIQADNTERQDYLVLQLSARVTLLRDFGYLARSFFYDEDIKVSLCSHLTSDIFVNRI